MHDWSQFYHNRICKRCFEKQEYNNETNQWEVTND